MFQQMQFFHDDVTIMIAILKPTMNWYVLQQTTKQWNRYVKLSYYTKW